MVDDHTPPFTAMQYAVQAVMLDSLTSAHMGNKPEDTAKRFAYSTSVAREIQMWSKEDGGDLTKLSKRYARALNRWPVRLSELKRLGVRGSLQVEEKQSAEQRGSWIQASGQYERRAIRWLSILNDRGDYPSAPTVNGKK